MIGCLGNRVLGVRASRIGTASANPEFLDQPALPIPEI
jgi:hypothetical protein